jgi:hypothetical protein
VPELQEHAIVIIIKQKMSRIITEY